MSGARQVTKQELQEERDFALRDVVTGGVRVEAASVPPGTDGHRGDGRDLGAPVTVTQERRLAPRRPGPAHRGQQEKPALVQEDEICVQAPGFF